MSRSVTCASLILLASLSACGDDTPKKEARALDPVEAADASAAKPDAAAPDAAAPSESCDDDESTPGNDCATAVGCRAQPACGLAEQSCCVPGFDAANVACVEGLTCTKGSRATCDGPEDCRGKACCVDIGTGMTSCQDSCETFTLCHTDEDCPAGGECKAGKSFTWWGICG